MICHITKDILYDYLSKYKKENNWKSSIFLHYKRLQFSSVQSLSHVQLIATPGTATRQASLSIINSRSLLKLMFIESVVPSNHFILCCHLLLPPSIFPSIRVFSKESVFHIRWPKYLSFSCSTSPPNEYSGLISFRVDGLDLLSGQETLKSLLQHHSSKVSSLQHSACFIVQLSHPYMTNGKNIALTRRTFVGKVMSLVLNMLSRLAIAFLPRKKTNFMAAVTIYSDFWAQENKVSHCFHCLPICYEVMGPDAMIWVFWKLSFKTAFSLSSFISSRGSLVLLRFLP